jgi:tripartite-type tricarboxylate transporter receptor subunit TctC
MRLIAPMRGPFRLGVKIAAVVASVALIATFAEAETFPDRAVRIIVPYPATGSSDLLARYLAQKLQQEWKVPVIVDNRPGAAGNIGMNAVAHSPGHGYTLAMTNNAVAINVSLYEKSFDIENDFEPLGLIAATPMVLAVNPELSVRSIAELTALAKAEPGTLNYGSCGVGTPQHLAIELYRSMTNVQLFHVPYRGCAPAVAEAIADRVQILATTVAQMAPQLSTHLMRGLAVSSKRRSTILPDLPTLAEAGVADYDLDIWFGMMAPAGTPKQIVEKIHDDVAGILSTPESRKWLNEMGIEYYVSSREEHAQVLHDDIGKFAALIKELKLSHSMDVPRQ